MARRSAKTESSVNYKDVKQVLDSYLSRGLSPQEVTTYCTSPISNEKNRSASAHTVVDLTNIKKTDIVSQHLLNRVFAGHPANPSRVDSVNRLEAIFCPEAYSDSSGSSFENIQTDFEQRLIIERDLAFVGPKGIGKTIFINRWLNLRTRDFLEKRHKMLWFRIDVQKMYDLLEEEVTSHPEVCLKNYFWIHSAYVMLEYSGLVTNPKSANHELSELIMSVAKIWTSGREADVDAKIVMIKEFYKSVDSSDREFAKFPSERLIRALFLAENVQILEIFRDVFSEMCRIMNKHRIGILCIVDGIDNIAWSKRNSTYQRMCSDAREFLINIANHVPVDRRYTLFVTRPETIAELNIHPNGANSESKSGAVFKLFALRPPTFEILVQKKIHAARHSPAFADHRRHCIQLIQEANKDDIRSADILNGVLGNYQKKVNEFRSELVNQINRIICDVKPGFSMFYASSLHVESFSSEIFDDDIRSMIGCFRRSEEGRTLQEKAQIKGYQKVERLPEYFLLGDRLFFDSAAVRKGGRRLNVIPIGDVFPNIFWYDESLAGHHSEWHGLCGLRVLQLSSHKPMAAGDIMYFVHKFFGYAAEVIIEVVEAFIAYGLLNVTKLDEEQSPQFCDWGSDGVVFKEYRGRVITSRKGHLVATLSLSYLSYMYLLALDTPMKSYFLSRISGERYIRFYVSPMNKVERQYHFFDAMVPTVATLARHILHYHRSEMKLERLLKRFTSEQVIKVEEIFNRMGESGKGGEFIERIFELPDNWKDYVCKKLFRIIRFRGREINSDRNELALHILGTFRE